MGKASKWIRALLGLKKSDPSPNTAKKTPTRKKWSFAKSRKDKDARKSQHGVAPDNNDDRKHAIAVAEAAVKAAKAAAEVVKLTSRAAESGGDFNSVKRVSQNGASYENREDRAAVTIQSHFRAYLSRRALRALKALVKIQALVRGHISRKQVAENLRRMQALVRAQERARASRVLISEAPHSTIKSSHFNHTHEINQAPATREKFEQRIWATGIKHEQPMILKRNGSKSNQNFIYDPEKPHSIRGWTDRRTFERSWEEGSFNRIVAIDDDRSDKILEVDTGKRHVTPKSRKTFHSSHLNYSSDQYCQSLSTSKDSAAAHHTKLLSPSSGEVQSSRRLKFAQDIADESPFYTAENSPLVYSVLSTGGSSKRASFTPSKSSDGSRSILGGYSDHPNYMAYTESSKAKVRSLSAPKQRPQYERSSWTSRYFVHGSGDLRSNTQKAFTLHANFSNKAYPGSGRLDRLGMPIRDDVSGFSGSHWHIY